MTINEVNENGTIRIEPDGRIDSVSCDTLRDTLLHAAALSGKDIILDLKKVDYIASAGLRAIFVGQKAADAKNKRMMLINANPQVMDTLRVSGFEQIFDIR